MIVTPYLRAGRVYRNQDAYEHGDSLGGYSVIINEDGKRIIETDRIAGHIYISIAGWNDKDVSKNRDFGYLPLRQT